jgi:hypothetical protein
MLWTRDFAESVECLQTFVASARQNLLQLLLVRVLELLHLPPVQRLPFRLLPRCQLPTMVLKVEPIVDFA